MPRLGSLAPRVTTPYIYDSSNQSTITASKVASFVLDWPFQSEDSCLVLLISMTAQSLCSYCHSIGWLEAGLPRVVRTAHPSLFSSSAEIRLVDGKIKLTSSDRLVEASSFLLSLGTVDEISQRRSKCQLCNFFLMLLERHFSPADIDKATQDNIPVHIYTRRQGAVVDTPHETSSRTHVMCFRLGFHPSFPCGSIASFRLLCPLDLPQPAYPICVPIPKRPTFIAWCAHGLIQIKYIPGFTCAQHNTALYWHLTQNRFFSPVMPSNMYYGSSTSWKDASESSLSKTWMVVTWP